MTRRVVVTGLGAVTPIGNNVQEFWNNALAGKSGIGKITEFDASNYPVQIAGEVKNFNAAALIGDRKAVRHMDRFAQFALVASMEAMNDSKIDMDKENPDRAGTVIGTGIGGIQTMEKVVKTIEDKGPKWVNPFAVPMMIANMAAAHVSIHFNLQGPVLSDSTACASGTDAIGLASRAIQHGDADIMIAGGSESAVCQAPMAGFAAMKALSSRDCPPEEASCPFSADRDGFVLGEGSAVMVLEELEHAKKRGAHIYAEIAGYGSNGDAYHITAPRPGGDIVKRCIERALEDAHVAPEKVDYINAHGTSTHLNDLNETKAIKEVLGKHAYEVPISSTKSMIGHLLGAAGSIGAVVCALSIETNKIHPTINLKHKDPECDLDYVSEGARDAKINVALSNAFGFGGHNSVLVLKRYEG